VTKLHEKLIESIYAHGLRTKRSMNTRTNRESFRCMLGILSVPLTVKRFSPDAEFMNVQFVEGFPSVIQKVLRLEVSVWIS
jgi:hypothetical protein